MQQEEDFSVTWNEVKGLVDKFIDDENEKMSMGEIEFAVKKAWKVIFDDRCRKYGIKFEGE